MDSEERLPVIPDEALDALTPPASVSVAAALEHQGPVARTCTENRKSKREDLISTLVFFLTHNSIFFSLDSLSHETFD